MEVEYSTQPYSSVNDPNAIYYCYYCYNTINNKDITSCT